MEITERKTDYDVIIVGCGVAGIAAALSAARAGAKTLVTESTFLAGGLATAGLVTYYLPLCDGNGTQLCYGIAEELLKLSVSCGADEPVPEEWLRAATKEERSKRRYAARFNPYVFAVLAEKLLEENGADILYGGTLSTVFKNEAGNKIEKIAVVTRTETLVFGAKTFIDCTGDAVLCDYSGEDTVLSGCGNVLAAWYYEVSEGEYRLKMKGSGDLAYSSPLACEKTFRGLDPFELSETVRKSRGVVLNDFLKNGKESAKHALGATASIPQVRMTRRLKGVSGVSVNDDKRFFEESVGTFGSWKERGRAYELPIGSFYGRKIKNLLAAGRCVSVADDGAWDDTRVIPVCALTGEIAGVIAALYEDTEEIDIKIIRKTLSERGLKMHLNECYSLKNK